MAISDFYFVVGVGSNLNAGSTQSGTPIFSDVTSNGSWNGTSTYTPTSGVTPASTVNIGDWCSIYTNQAATPYIAQVTAVAAGANGVITLSTTAKFGSVPASSAVANCIDGGCWADFGMLAAGVALTTGTVSQSTRMNIKAGTYANGATARSTALAGAATTPLIWRGYKTTPGDQDTNFQAVAGTDIPLLTFTSGIASFSGTASTFMNLAVTGANTASNGQTNIAGTVARIWNCQFTNTATGSTGNFALRTGGGTVLAGCSVSVTATNESACINYLGTCTFFGCYFKGGTLVVSATTNAATFVDCIFDSQGSDCIAVSTGGLLVSNCTFYNGGGNGINITGAVGTIAIVNPYFEGLTTAAKANINNTSGTNTASIVYVGGTYFNCTADTAGFGDYPTFAGSTLLGASGLTSPGSQNFTPLSALYAAGIPGAFPTLSAFRSNVDVGAVQHAGGGGIVGGIMRVSGQSFPCH